MSRRPAAVEKTARELWREVLVHYGDEALHEAFIQRATKEGNLRFALDCYRTFEKLRPGDVAAHRYMKQVAKAMELGALGPHRSVALPTDNPAMRRTMRVLVTLVIGVVALLGIYLAVSVARQGTR